MERLTKYICDHAHGAEGVRVDNLTGDYCRGEFEATAIVDRLASIEDILGDEYDLDRLRELAQADREGPRCNPHGAGHPAHSGVGRGGRRGPGAGPAGKVRLQQNQAVPARREGVMKKLELCRPCAEKLKEAYTVKPAGGIAKKITCQQCGKRRYGVTYQIEKK